MSSNSKIESGLSASLEKPTSSGINNGIQSSSTSDLKNDGENVTNNVDVKKKNENDLDLKSAINKPNQDESFESDIKNESPSVSRASKLDLPKRKHKSKTQGKTFYPKNRKSSKEDKEIKELRRMEKNLMIDGLPVQPKIRKRRFSASSGSGKPHDKDYNTKKKRKQSCPEFIPKNKKDHMPKWESVLGGDAGDPLNLNGLAKSEEGRLLNMRTPESSPLPMPEFRKIVYVRVPPNIEDPLNLEGKHDQKEIDRMLDAHFRKRHRPPKRKGKRSESDAETFPAKVGEDEGKDLQQDIEDDAMQTETKENVSNPTPSVLEATATVIPAEEKKSNKPACGNNTLPHRSVSRSPERKFNRRGSFGKKNSVTSKQKEPKFSEKPMFIYGNYNRYYGYRNMYGPDPRLEYFDPCWFEGKDVLDIGCNVGHITLAIAEQFKPHKIQGIDIDGSLITAARQNIRYKLSARRKDSSRFPSVFEMTKGPLEAHPLTGSSNNFPNNVLFVQVNYFLSVCSRNLFIYYYLIGRSVLIFLKDSFDF